MATHTLNVSGRLDFPQRIDDLIHQTEKYAALCASPKRVEFKFCALLASWEATACHNSEASHWFDIWQKHCLKHHRGTARRTLADPVKASLLTERWHVPQKEETKAYANVRDGMGEVFKATLRYHGFEKSAGPSFTPRMDEASVLYQKVHTSFSAA